MHRVRFTRRTVTPLLVGAAALAAPATATAGQDYVIMLAATTEQCASTITAVTTQYGVTPYATYTSVTCGFSATMPKRTADDLAGDPRVKSVNGDGNTRLAL